LRYRGAAQAELTRALRTLKALQAEKAAPRAAAAAEPARSEPTAPTPPARISARGAPDRRTTHLTSNEPTALLRPNEPAPRPNPNEPAPRPQPKEPEQPSVVEASTREPFARHRVCLERRVVLEATRTDRGAATVRRCE
jgi:hypothetical protein